jgi:hypothetical protein
MFAATHSETCWGHQPLGELGLFSSQLFYSNGMERLGASQLGSTGLAPFGMSYGLGCSSWA